MIIYYLQKWIFKLLNKDNTGQISSVPMTKQLVGVLLLGIPLGVSFIVLAIAGTFVCLTATAKQTHTSNVYNVFFDRSISFFLLLGLSLEKINCTILLYMLLKTEVTAKIFLVKILYMLNLLMTGFGSVYLIAYFHHYVNSYPAASGSSIDAFYLGIVLIIFVPLLIFQLFVTSLRKSKKRSKKPSAEE